MKNKFDVRIVGYATREQAKLLDQICSHTNRTQSQTIRDLIESAGEELFCANRINGASKGANRERSSKKLGGSRKGF